MTTQQISAYIFNREDILIILLESGGGGGAVDISVSRWTNMSTQQKSDLFTFHQGREHVDSAKSLDEFFTLFQER
jgi:hypothetical protein